MPLSLCRCVPRVGQTPLALLQLPDAASFAAAAAGGSLSSPAPPHQAPLPALAALANQQAPLLVQPPALHAAASTDLPQRLAPEPAGEFGFGRQQAVLAEVKRHFLSLGITWSRVGAAFSIDDFQCFVF